MQRLYLLSNKTVDQKVFKYVSTIQQEIQILEQFNSEQVQDTKQNYEKEMQNQEDKVFEGKENIDLE